MINLRRRWTPVYRYFTQICGYFSDENACLLDVEGRGKNGLDDLSFWSQASSSEATANHKPVLSVWAIGIRWWRVLLFPSMVWWSKELLKQRQFSKNLRSLSTGKTAACQSIQEINQLFKFPLSEISLTKKTKKQITKN